MNVNNKNDLLITSLPQLNQSTVKAVPIKNTSVNVGNSKCMHSYNEIHFHINDKYLHLKGVDHDKDHLRREEKFFENLPLLKHRTFHQMREYYHMKSKLNKRIEQKHFADIKSSSLSEGKNSSKVISLIAQKKISILNKIPLYKLQKMLSD